MFDVVSALFSGKIQTASDVKNFIVVKNLSLVYFKKKLRVSIRAEPKGRNSNLKLENCKSVDG